MRTDLISAIFSAVFFLILTGCVGNSDLEAEVSTESGAPTAITDSQKVTLSTAQSLFSLAEGQAVTVVITFDRPTLLAGNFVWSLSGSAGDWAADSGTVHLAAGASQLSLPLQVASDTLFEVDESYTLTVSSSVARNTINIQFDVANDDPVPSLTIIPSGLNEGQSGAMTFRLSNPSYQTIIIDYSIANVTATYGVDFTATPGPTGIVTIPAGQTTGTLAWQALDDGDVEAISETATLTASKNFLSGDFTVSPATQTMTVYDNEIAAVYARFDLTTQSVSESIGQVPITFSLNKASGSVVDIAYNVGGTGATNPDDYVLASGVLRFQPGETQKTIYAQITNDSIAEISGASSGRINIVQSITLGATWTGPTSHTIYIIDDDGIPTLNLAATSGSYSEADGTITIPYTLSQVHGDNIQLFYSFSGTARATHDFTTSAWIIIPAGTTSGNITIPLLDDSRDEPTETLILTVAANSVSYLLGTSLTYTATIIDNDSQPTIDLQPVTQKEGCGAVFYAKLSIPAGHDVTFNYASAAGTATAGVDYTTVSGTRTIPAGRKGIGILVPFIDDGPGDADETMTLTISNVSGAILGTDSAIGTLKESFPSFPAATNLNPGMTGGLYSSISTDSCFILANGIAPDYDVSASFLVYVDLFSGNNIPLSDEGEAILEIHSFAENPSRILVQKQAVIGQNPRKIFAVDIDGHNKIDLTPAGAGAFNFVKMSSDGQKFLFSAGPYASTRQEFYAVDVNALTAPTTPFVDCGANPGCINPNNQVNFVNDDLFYLSDSRVLNQFELYVKNIAGGAASKLHSDLPANRSIQRFAITPDDQKVVFSSDKDNGSSGMHDLFSVDIDGTDEVKVNSAGHQGVRGFGLSNNSQKAAWVQENGRLIVANLDGTAELQIGLNDGNHGLSTTNLAYLKFSPNNNYVVGCLYDNISTKYHVYSYKVDGTAEVTLNSSANILLDLHFSTDSLLVLYQVGNGTAVLVAESVDGGVETTISPGVHYSHVVIDAGDINGYVTFSSKNSTLDYRFYRKRKLDGTATGSVDYTPTNQNSSYHHLDKVNNLLIWGSHAGPMVQNP